MEMGVADSEVKGCLEDDRSEPSWREERTSEGSANGAVG